MCLFVSNRKLNKILAQNKSDYDIYVSGSIRDWLHTGNDTILSSHNPELYKVLVELKVPEAHNAYRQALENRILCLCLKYGKDVTIKDQRDNYPNPNPVEMTYENAIIFTEKKTLGNYNVAGVCYSLKNDKEWDKYQGPHGPQLEHGRHPGLEFIVSTKWLARDEADSLCVFNVQQLEQLIQWIDIEIKKRTIHD